VGSGDSLAPEKLRETLRGRLCDAESRRNRSKALVDWQIRLIDQMRAQRLKEIALAQEILALLSESLAHNEARLAEIKRNMDFLSRDQTAARPPKSSGPVS
jgi:hypothetical protein